MSNVVNFGTFAPSIPPFFEAALWWFGQGLNVVPRNDGEKHPAVKWKEFQVRRVTEIEIRKWQRKFEGGVGCITGAISNLVVIESDGPIGGALLKEFEAIHGPLPATRRVRSGSGRGIHWHFQHPGHKVTTKANTKIQLDVKGDGGFVVLPPSLHKSGGQYELVDAVVYVAPLPDKLLEFIEQKASEAEGKAFRAKAKNQNSEGAMSPLAAACLIPPRQTAYTPYEEARLRSMLDYLVENDLIPLNERDDWRDLGMALYELGWPRSREIWDEYSKRAEPRERDGKGTYDEQGEEIAWTSFARSYKGRRKTILSFFKLAHDNGWPDFPCSAPATVPTVDAGSAAQAIAVIGQTPDGKPDPTQFLRTDAGNALLFVELFKENVRYIEKWKTWIVWDGKRWVETSNASMLPLARAATEHMFTWAAKLPEERREELRKHALATQREPRLRAMLDLAKGEEAIRIDPDRLDAGPWLLGCPNGVLDLRTGQLRPPRREDFITKSIAVDYDPQATCPNWLAFLEWVTQGDRDTIEHFQRLAGYILTGRVEEEKLFAFFGSGDNGKTTFAITLYDLLRDYAGKARKDLLLQSQGEKGAASPDVAALQGKRLVIVSETDEGCSLAEAQIKEITANEPIPARRLHKDPFTFIPSHKIFLLTNHRPFVKGTDEGIWRRLNIVGFPAKISEAEKDISFRESKLLPELAGILGWAVAGCLKWQHDGLKPSAAVRRAATEYRSEMDFIGQWIEERCERVAGAFTPKAVAYSDYEIWARMEHYPTLGSRRFGEELHTRGFERHKGDVWGFRGLRVKAMSLAMKLVS